MFSVRKKAQSTRTSNIKNNLSSAITSHMFIIRGLHSLPDVELTAVHI